MRIAAIKNQIDALNTRLHCSLADVSVLSSMQGQTIIRRYTAAFIGNFITWLGAGAIASRSAEGRYAMAENLEVEFAHDHQTMLWNFSNAVNALPNAEDYLAVQPAVLAIRKQVAALNGVQLNALAAILESASLVFIPYLESVALKVLGTHADLQYTRVHGEADIKHADQFIQALSVEAQKNYPEPEKDLHQMLVLCEKLLNVIFIEPAMEVRHANIRSTATSPEL